MLKLESTPSITIRFWLRSPNASKPDCWALWEPATSKPRIRIPGVSASIACGSVELGTSRIAVSSKVPPKRLDFTSTTGDSPVTVTVSATAATESVWFTVNVCPVLLIKISLQLVASCS